MDNRPSHRMRDLFGCPVDTSNQESIATIDDYIIGDLSYHPIDIARLEAAISADAECCMLRIAYAQALWKNQHTKKAREALRVVCQMVQRRFRPDGCGIPEKLGIPTSSADAPIPKRIVDSAITFPASSVNLRVWQLAMGTGLFVFCDDFGSAGEVFLSCLSPMTGMDLWALKLAELCHYVSGRLTSLLDMYIRLSDLFQYSSELKKIFEILGENSGLNGSKHSLPISYFNISSDDISPLGQIPSESSRTPWSIPQSAASYFAGMLGFALSQSGRPSDIERALKLLAFSENKRKLTVRIPFTHTDEFPLLHFRDPWTVHAAMHALYNSGEYCKSLEVAMCESKHWGGGDPFIYRHMWWHVGIVLVDMGLLHAAFALFQTGVWGGDKQHEEVQAGALSLLLRLIVAVQERQAVMSIWEETRARSSVYDYAADLAECQRSVEALKVAVLASMQAVIQVVEQSKTLLSGWSGMFEAVIVASSELIGRNDVAAKLVARLTPTKNLPRCMEAIQEAACEEEQSSEDRESEGPLAGGPPSRVESDRIWRLLVQTSRQWGSAMKVLMAAPFVGLGYSHQSSATPTSLHPAYIPSVSSVRSWLSSVAFELSLEVARLTHVGASIEQADWFAEMCWNSIVNWGLVSSSKMCSRGGASWEDRAGLLVAARRMWTWRNLQGRTTKNMTYKIRELLLSYISNGSIGALDDTSKMQECYLRDAKIWDVACHDKDRLAWIS